MCVDTIETWSTEHLDVRVVNRAFDMRVVNIERWSINTAFYGSGQHMNGQLLHSEVLVILSEVEHFNRIVLSHHVIWTQWCLHQPCSTQTSFKREHNPIIPTRSHIVPLPLWLCGSCGPVVRLLGCWRKSPAFGSRPLQRSAMSCGAALVDMG